MAWKVTFVGLAAVGLAGLVAWVITDEAWFLVAPFLTMAGMLLQGWMLDRKIAELKRQLGR